MDPAYCPRLNECSKVRSIMDRDMTFHQYAESIRKVCAECTITDASIITSDSIQGEHITAGRQTDWTRLEPFGFTADIYAKGAKRRLVETETGRIILEYDVAVIIPGTRDINSQEKRI